MRIALFFLGFYAVMFGAATAAGVLWVFITEGLHRFFF